MRAGGATIDPSITDGAISNPLETADDDAETFDLAANPQLDDGTVDNVLVTTDATFEPDGSGTLETSVTEGTTPGGFEFLKVVSRFDRPKISFRDFPNGYGYADLDPVTGNGFAYILCRIERSFTTTRTFDNTSTTTETLVAPAAAPVDGTDTMDMSQVFDFLVVYEITGSGAAREANIVNLEIVAGSVLEEARSGTPASRLRFRFSDASIDGVEGDANGDVVIPIGTDVDQNGFADGDAITFRTRVIGGLENDVPGSQVNGVVANNEIFNSRTFTFTDTIDVDETRVNDGILDIEGIFVATESEELTSPDLEHTLNGEIDGHELSFEKVLFMHSEAEALNVFWVFF